MNSIQQFAENCTASGDAIQDAERRLLGALMLDNECETGGVTAEDFSSASHRAVFQAIQRLTANGAPADLTTVKHELERSNELARVGGPGAIASLTSDVPTAANAAYYGGLIRDEAHRRRVSQALRQAEQSLRGGAETETVLQALENETARRKVNGHDLPAIKTATEILNGVYPAPRYLVEGVVPDVGLGIVAGPKAAGKTQALLSIAAAVSCGGRALGRLRCEQARVLYLQLELSERRVHERLNRLYLDGDLSGLDFAHVWPTGTEAVTAIERAITTRGYGLVIVDVLQKIWPAGRDAQAYQDAYIAMSPLRELANRTGTAILCATHLRKAGADDLLDRVVNSVGIVGNADVIAMIESTRGTHDGSLSVVGNDVPPLETAMRFDPETAEWVITDANPLEARQSPERREILDYLREHGPARSSDVADAIGKSAQAVSNLLSKLKREGAVTAPKYGMYTIPPRVGGEFDVSAAAERLTLDTSITRGGSDL